MVCGRHWSIDWLIDWLNPRISGGTFETFSRKTTVQGISGSKDAMILWVGHRTAHDRQAADRGTDWQTCISTTARWRVAKTGYMYFLRNWTNIIWLLSITSALLRAISMDPIKFLDQTETWACYIETRFVLNDSDSTFRYSCYRA